MLTARNAILTWIVLLAVSVLWSGWTSLRPPDSGGLAADSFGTRYSGHRAILETLSELHVPARRSLTPPNPQSLGHSTLVLWNPNANLVRVESVWLTHVKDWVHAGGRVVVAMTDSSTESLSSMSCADGKCRQLEGVNRSITEALGLSDVSVNSSESPKDKLQKLAKSGQRPFEDLPDLIRQTEEDVLGITRKIALQVGDVAVSGDWEKSLTGVKRLTLPAGHRSEIRGDESMRTSSVTLTDAYGEHCVAASFTVGQGEIVCLSIPELLGNGCIGETDNVVLATSLLVSGDRAVVFDEFFHGVSVRGNPMWLFAQRTYGSVAVALLSLAGVWAWRRAIRLGPPLPDRTKSRRSIGEYVDAMSRFLLEAAGHRRYLAAQVRDGAVWHLRKEFHLPPDGGDREQLLSAMRRREPGRAAELHEALLELDQILSAPGAVARNACETALKRITACL